MLTCVLYALNVETVLLLQKRSCFDLFKYFLSGNCGCNSKGAVVPLETLHVGVCAVCVER